ncbi:trans-2-enoyl-CoA reductase, partial [Clostridium beijerinckii]
MRKRNFMLSVLICSSMITANVVPAFAYNLEGNGLKGGVENVTYYVDSSASGLKNKISLAASSWNGTDTPVYLKNVTSSSKSVVDIYYTNSAFSSSDNRNGTVAQTTYIPDSENYWTNAKIEVNPTVYDNLT